MEEEDAYTYCDARRTDRDCLCLFPEDAVLKIGHDTLLPYYCWYEPCKRPTARLTEVLKDAIKKCNVTNCNVAVGDVRLVDGYLEINNTCLSSTIFPVGFRTRQLRQRVALPLLSPPLVCACLIAVCALIAMR
ncbi:ORF127 [Saltwater crocodilepox virus]|nr:hypothetical protein [Saltwater crocodilepox virus]AVD69462.1 hypothetical protein [Saltwater crocodilepox virus]QGT46565.1 ORF127 [Saltwater crocodilepox virus]QGT46781.1 ORF127 [Saltwater crocodilepox virus]QGT46997.1 ORF127 [Saltwater crocodilepox virus]